MFQITEQGSVFIRPAMQQTSGNGCSYFYSLLWLSWFQLAIWCVELVNIVTQIRERQRRIVSNILDNICHLLGETEVGSCEVTWEPIPVK